MTSVLDILFCTEKSKNDGDIASLFSNISCISVLKNVVELSKIKPVSLLYPYTENMDKLLELIHIL